jgi:hypothetical protein
MNGFETNRFEPQNVGGMTRLPRILGTSLIAGKQVQPSMHI